MNDSEILQIIQEIASQRSDQIQQIIQKQEEIEEIGTICGYGIAALSGVIIAVFILIPFFQIGDKL